MKNKIIAFATILFISLAAMAQSSMTDDQVLKYLVTETQKGTSQQKMAAELLKKGVTTSQLQRVRKKAEKLREESKKENKDKKTEGNSKDNKAEALATELIISLATQDEFSFIKKTAVFQKDKKLLEDYYEYRKAVTKCKKS